MRIHIPMQTNPGVEFYVSGERMLLEEGGAYYVNVNLPHRVNNRGATERIHLVIDAPVNEWMREIFARSAEIPQGAPPELGVEAFREWAAARPAVREQLRGVEDVARFAGDAVRLGREAGFAFHEGDVDAMVRGAARPGIAGGLPIEVEIRGGQPYVTWIDRPERPFTEPFFEDTVRACLRLPYTRFSRRAAPLGPGSGMAPRGFIFHMSRCGSTLVARLLAEAGLRVISEAPPVDCMMQTGNAKWVRWMVEAMGGGEPYIVKLDAWHVHNLPFLREVFPETPWIFVHRDPAEVLASHGRSPGRHMLPGGLEPRTVGLTMEAMTSVDREEWGARVLAGICEAALEQPGGLFVDYRSLPEAVWTVVADHFGVAIPAAVAARMREAAGFDVKRPQLRFSPDGAAKRAEGEPLAGLIARVGLDRQYLQLQLRSA